MLDINAWMEKFQRALAQTFPGRLWFVGLQGSRARGEATAESDIDVVVVLDTLTAEDIRRYSAMLDTLPERHLICGFLSGRDELLHWAASDLFQFCHDTRPYLGSLDDVLALVSENDVRQAVHLAACNIYHACVHNIVHEKSPAILAELYKAACFSVQAICYLQTGRYVREHAALVEIAAPEERTILTTRQALKRGDSVDFAEASDALFHWAQAWILAQR